MVIHKAQAIELANKTHNGKFDYSSVNYKKITDKVSIYCLSHKITFQQAMNKHIAGQGCPTCGIERRAALRTKTTETFISQAKEIHGDIYVYDHVSYSGDRVKVSIVCSTHGVYQQSPGDHLRGNGCSSCAGNIRKTTQQFIDEVCLKYPDNKEQFNYSHVDYKGMNIKVNIVCNLCDSAFEQTPHHHLNRGDKCPHCSKNKKISVEDFIERANKVHLNRFTYAKVSFQDNSNGIHQKVIITCPEHGDFLQSAHSHLSGCGCNNCRHKTEQLVLSYLRSLLYNPQGQFRPDWSINPKTTYKMPFDIVIEDLKIIIEIDGPQHFDNVWKWGDFEETQERDIIKMKAAMDNGYSIIRCNQKEVFENKTVWLDEILKQLLHIYDTPTVHWLSYDTKLYDMHKYKLSTIQV
jgi:very-short-patch-repair endonuclease